MSKRTVTLDERLDHMDSRFDRIEARMEAQFGRIHERFERMETRMEAQFDRMARAIAQGFSLAAEDRQRIRGEVSSALDSYSRAVDVGIKRTETYYHEMLAVSAKVDRLEDRVERPESAE